jgi:4-hydroxyphenylacetate 3-monooxygenase
VLAYARDLLNSDYAGHRLTFQLFAQSPPFSHLLAVYNNYDFGSAVERMAKSAGLEVPSRVWKETLR